MSLNKIVINDREWLTWEVEDEDMHGLIEWLNENAIKEEEKEEEPDSPYGDEEDEIDNECICNCIEEDDDVLPSAVRVGGDAYKQPLIKHPSL